ncbi:MAG TPA: hypothetical protein VFD84_08560 [Candidatus Binatia bacterium]|nr:hypothetical protein [Candidatus Binatia bacterium]
MESDDLVTLANVQVIRDTEVALLCRIAGVVRFIPQAELRPGSVTEPGVEGQLVVTRRLAVELGLV